MGVLNDNIFDEIIQVRDRYNFTLFRIDNPTTGFDFLWRGIDILNRYTYFEKVRGQLVTDIMYAPITKVCTAHRYAYIKRCILKHVADGVYRGRWKTEYGVGLGTWLEPDRIYITYEARISGAWITVVQIGLGRISSYDNPF